MLTVNYISKSFNENIILEDLSFHVIEGESFAIFGKSGSGKTTIFRIIAGLIKPDRGEILINNINYTRLPTNQRPLGFQFQSYALFPNMNVEKNIYYPITSNKNRISSSQKILVEEIIYQLDCMNILDRQIQKLSGGEQQRVALARALVRAISVKGILLLDEPVSALDEALRESARNMMRQIQVKYKLTSIFITHDIRDVIRMADRIGVLENGKIIQTGSLAEVSETPQTEGVALSFGYKFIGKGNLEDIQGNTFLTLNGQKLQINVKFRNYSKDHIYKCFVPSNSITINNDNDKILMGKIISLSETASSYYLSIILDGQIINLDIIKDKKSQLNLSNENISLNINLEKLCLFM